MSGVGSKSDVVWDNFQALLTKFEARTDKRSLWSLSILRVEETN